MAKKAEHFCQAESVTVLVSRHVPGTSTSLQPLTTSQDHRLRTSLPRCSATIELTTHLLVRVSLLHLQTRSDSKGGSWVTRPLGQPFVCVLGEVQSLSARYKLRSMLGSSQEHTAWQQTSLLLFGRDQQQGI
eukprot:2435790-Amphidinium_carterae.1